MAVTANSTPAPSRRAFFGSAVAAGIGAAQILPLGEVADAAILAFGPRLEPLVVALAEAEREQSRMERIAFDLVGPCPPAYTAEAKEWAGRLAAAQRACGQEKAEHAALRAQSDLLAALEDLADLRATTVAGLAYKAGLARKHSADYLADSVFDDLIALNVG